MTTAEAPEYVPPAMAPRPEGRPALVDDPSFLTVVRVLLLLQSGIAFTSFLEVTIAGAGFGVPLFILMGLNLGLAVLNLYLAKRIPHGGRKARRVVMWLQCGWLLFAAIDLTLSLAMTQRLLEPVPILTRIVVPIALIRMLRSSRARLLFKVPPSRRQRRKARKRARVVEAST